jgi:prophage maintenance system killer protein
MKKHALIFTFSFAALLSVTTTLAPSLVHASSKPGACELLFKNGAKPAGKSDLDLIQHSDFGSYWAQTIQQLKSAKAVSSIGTDRLESWLIAHFFFDRIEVAASVNREFADLTSLWDQDGVVSPFLPFKKTFTQSVETIGQSKKALSLAAIADLHHSMMNGVPEIRDARSGDISWLKLIRERAFFQWKNVEGIKSKDIGKVRKTPVVFILPVTDRKKDPHFTNPLLSVQRSEDQLKDYVYYARLTEVDQYINQLSPRVRGLVDEARRNNLLKDDNAELTEAVLTDLLNTAIGEHTVAISRAKTLEERVEAHAAFVWKFVSIHPFVNGNGRTARALLGQLLMQEGLVPPLLKNQNDVTVSAHGFAKDVKEGIVLAQKFMDDVLWRSENGWEPTKSPMTLLARLPQRIYFDTLQKEIGHAYADVDVYDFAQFLRMREASNRGESETELLRAYVAHLKRWTAYRAKTGEEYQVRFVPAEMQKAALEIDSPNTLKWMTKKHLFYSTDLAWRGLGSQTPMSLDKLLEIFVKPSDILLSMHSSGARNQDEIEQSVKQDFEAFNKSVLNPKTYFKMASDHMKAEGNYPNSPLLSAAMTRAVADRFSKGFLTGKENILNQRGQLVVASLTPEFGTAYFNRLGPISKRLDLGFVSQYPRQMEIAIAGVMAPDSVMRVEYKDVKVLNVAENTGENIAGETVVNSVTILERDPVQPAIIKATVQDAEGSVISIRRFKISLVEGAPQFQEIK